METNRIIDKQLENILFKVYEKGVQFKDCDLTQAIEDIKQVITPSAAKNQRKLLLNYFKWHKKKNYISHKDSDINEFITDYNKSSL